jgi:hypothetical protein
VALGDRERRRILEQRLRKQDTVEAEAFMRRREQARAEQARAALKKWNGYALPQAEEQDLDSELDRRLAQAAAR